MEYSDVFILEKPANPFPDTTMKQETPISSWSYEYNGMIKLIIQEQDSDNTFPLVHDEEDSVFVSKCDISQIASKQQKLTQQLVNQALALKQNSGSKDPSKQEFKWVPELHEKFVLICCAIGVRKVTPKQVQIALQNDVSRESIGSHLQKFRIKLVKQYKLNSSMQLTDRHLPTDCSCERFKAIQKMWESNKFQGMNAEDVQKFIQ